MPKAPVVEVEGSCGFKVTTKTWKQGHSIKCSRRGGNALRYWQPDKTSYAFTHNFSTDIEAELWDFCRTCRFRKDRQDEGQRVPLCPRCNQPMTKIQARDHWFYRCLNVSVYHDELFGIVGRASNFRTRRLVDPVTMKIVDNPNFRANPRGKKRKTKKLLEYYEIEIDCPDCGHDRGVVTKQYVRCLKCNWSNEVVENG